MAYNPDEIHVIEIDVQTRGVKKAEKEIDSVTRKTSKLQSVAKSGINISPVERKSLGSDKERLTYKFTGAELNQLNKIASRWGGGKGKGGDFFSAFAERGGLDIKRKREIPFDKFAAKKEREADTLLRVEDARSSRSEIAELRKIGALIPKPLLKTATFGMAGDELTSYVKDVYQYNTATKQTLITEKAREKQDIKNQRESDKRFRQFSAQTQVMQSYTTGVLPSLSRMYTAFNKNIPDGVMKTYRSFQRMDVTAGKFKRATKIFQGLEMSILKANMSSLGMYFSVMSAFNLIRTGIIGLFSPLGDLSTMFKSMALGEAFGGFDLEMDTDKMVTGWMRLTGLTSGLQAGIAKLGAEIMFDDEVWAALKDGAEQFMKFLGDPETIAGIKGLVKALAEELPKIAQSLPFIISVMKMATPHLSSLIKIGIAAAFAMPFFAIINGVTMFIGAIVQATGFVYNLYRGIKMLGAAKTIGALFSGGGIGGALNAASAIPAIVPIGTSISAALIGGILAGLGVGFLAVYTMLELGFLQLIDDIGRWFETTPIGEMIMDILKVTLSPLGAIGGVIIRICQGDFAGIPDAFASPFIQAYDVIKSYTDRILNFISDFVAEFKRRLSDIGFNESNPYYVGLQTGLSSAFGIDTRWMGGHAAGGYIQDTGYSLLHRGEYVVPRNQTVSSQTSSSTQTNNINIYVNGTLDRRASDDLLTQLTDALKYGV